MKSSEFIFKGKQFRHLEEFESEFKPTKWSIRKFMNFIEEMDTNDQYRFANHTIRMFTNYFTFDKDAQNFIRQIKDKKADNFGVDGYRSKYDLKPSMKVREENYNHLIEQMAILKNDKIIEGTAKKVAEILIDEFGVKLSISVITNRISKYIAKMNE